VTVKDPEIQGQQEQDESRERKPDDHHDLLVAVSLRVRLRPPELCRASA
jgi:hypothetical protein